MTPVKNNIKITSDSLTKPHFMCIKETKKKHIQLMLTKAIKFEIQT